MCTCSRQVATALVDGDDAPADGHAGSGTDAGSTVRRRAEAAVDCIPRFLLLDLRRVRGMDGTAASGFGALANTLARLQVHGFACTRCVRFASLELPKHTCWKQGRTWWRWLASETEGVYW